MATKDVLKHGENYVPTINDNASTEFEAYETYSRQKIDSLMQNTSGNGGYDWSDRMICFDGDSLTQGGNGKFSTVTVAALGCSEKNIAQGGVALFPDNPGNTYDFRQRVSRIPHNADLIFICGDFNAGSLVAKTAADCYVTGLDTWAGRWNAALMAIKKSFPTVPVMLVSPWATPLTSTKNTHILKYNPQAMRTFAEYYGCYFMNFATETPMNLAFGHAVWAPTGEPNVHNNQAAADLVGMVLADRIRTIPAPVWSDTDSIMLDKTTATVAVGSTVEITPTTTGNHTNAWTSSDNSVACVLGGVVYGMAAGTVTITAKTHNGNTAACTVTVAD